MKYDFDSVIDRSSTDCAKWGAVETFFGSKDLLPMWVADMDFPIAKPITQALMQRTEHEIYGYSRICPSVIESVIGRMKRKYGWEVKPEWIVFTPGIVPALHAAVKAYTHPGDEVIIQEPVYHPFRSAVTSNGCSVVNNELKLANGHYEVDFVNLERAFHPEAVGMMSPAHRIRMMLMCNPHNPVGRVWSRDELTRMGDIVIDNDAIMVSDEIHCELLFQGFKHISFALSEKFERNCLVCMAPSKTFNIAGLGASTVIIPNAGLRNRFSAARAGIMPRPNVFALVALESAYRYGDEWLEQLLDYLQGNLKLLAEYFGLRIPKIKVIKPEGTYLVWLDCRGLGMDPSSLRAFFIEKAKVGLEDGTIFGSSGAGFQRMNIACPRSTLNEALKRIEHAVNSV